MPHAFGLMTQDAALAPCELDRVRQAFAPAAEEVVGVGGWQDGQVVLRRFGAGVSTSDDSEVWNVPDSEALLLGSRPLGANQDLEGGSQPFRFRQWLFCAVGTLERTEPIRERLWEELPEFLQGAVTGRSWEEAAFARFLANLRELGRIEDHSLDARTAGQCLSACVRAITQLSTSSGVVHRPAFALLASNGRVMTAARSGSQSVSYALLEGQVECRRHGLGADAPEGEAHVRDHRRRKSVVISTGRLESSVALPDGATVSTDRRLTITIG